MPALGAGIHVLKRSTNAKDVDGRDKPGHDEDQTCLIQPRYDVTAFFRMQAVILRLPSGCASRV
jgi:hypothetical protein